MTGQRLQPSRGKVIKLTKTPEDHTGNISSRDDYNFVEFFFSRYVSFYSGSNEKRISLIKISTNFRNSYFSICLISWNISLLGTGTGYEQLVRFILSFIASFFMLNAIQSFVPDPCTLFYQYIRFSINRKYWRNATSVDTTYIVIII